MIDDFKQGDKVKLSKKREARRILGQGALPRGLFVSRDGYEVFIPEEQVMQVSEDGTLVIGDMAASPMPRIAAGFVNRNDFNERFSKVE